MIIIAPSSPQFIKWMARKPISPNRMPKVLCGRAPNSTHTKKFGVVFWPPNFVLIQMWWIFYDTTVKLSDEWMYGKTKGEVLESKKKKSLKGAVALLLQKRKGSSRSFTATLMAAIRERAELSGFNDLIYSPAMHWRSPRWFDATAMTNTFVGYAALSRHTLAVH